MRPISDKNTQENFQRIQHFDNRKNFGQSPKLTSPWLTPPDHSAKPKRNAAGARRPFDPG
jgi:hypothetical protein